MTGIDRDDSELVRAYRAGAGELPPPALDSRILAASRGRRHRPVWVLHLASAAVVVLGLSVLLQLRTVPGPRYQPAPAATQGAIEMVRAPEVPARKLEADATRIDDQKSSAESAERASSGRPEPVSAPRANGAGRQVTRVSPAPVPDATAPGRDEAKMAAPVATRERSPDFDDSVPGRYQVDDVPLPAEIKRLPAAPAGAVGPRIDASPGVARAARLAQSAEPGDAKAARDAWLERIRRLYAVGDPVAAQRELEAFRARYPDYPEQRLRDLTGTAPAP
ncbi:MAG: hypothetical protein AB7Q97_07540 [Gammaproteobacteria bacterium]